MTTMTQFPTWVAVMLGIASAVTVLKFIMAAIGTYLEYKRVKAKEQREIDMMKDRFEDALQKHFSQMGKQKSQNEPPSDLLTRQTKYN